MLVIGSPEGNTDFLSGIVLAPDGLLIVMEGDTARAADIRRNLSHGDLANRTTVIGGDPRRMLYKLAGPFDLIVCSPAYVSTRPVLEKLLAPDGVIITT